MANPWLVLLDNPPQVTKEQLKRVQEVKHLIQPQKRYHLPLKYFRDDATHDLANGSSEED